MDPCQIEISSSNSHPCGSTSPLMEGDSCSSNSTGNAGGEAKCQPSPAVFGGSADARPGNLWKNPLTWKFLDRQIDRLVEVSDRVAADVGFFFVVLPALVVILALTGNLPRAWTEFSERYRKKP